jgi:hypothetical protein
MVESVSFAYNDSSESQKPQARMNQARLGLQI